MHAYLAEEERAFSVILQDLPTAGVTGIAGIDVSVTLCFGCCDVETALATALFQLATSLSRTDSIKRTAATDRCEQSGHVSRLHK